MIQDIFESAVSIFESAIHEEFVLLGWVSLDSDYPIICFVLKLYVST